MTTPPRVLFVCVKNGGKSQMAAGLMSDFAGDTIDAVSAGTQPGTSLNQLSVQSLDELGIDISHGNPKPVSEADLKAADIVITLGRAGTVELPTGTALENRAPEAPPERRLPGVERMRVAGDDIRSRVETVHSRRMS